MISRDRMLHAVIPYRMQAIDTMRVALELRLTWDVPKSMKILFDDKVTIQGNSAAWFNPVYEAGVIHCRALLEFLGIKLDKAGRLASRMAKQRDDVGIEDYSGTAGPLPKVSPSAAIAIYPDRRSEVEKALMSALHVGNKALAHTTTGLIEELSQAHHMLIAAEVVPALIGKYLYETLGLGFDQKTTFPAPASLPSSGRCDLSRARPLNRQ